MGPHSVNYGQVIEYIQDRLYLASYTHAPNENTPFPYPTETRKSPSKKSSKSQHGPIPVSRSRVPPVYFTIDDTLLYNAFHADFGPLHIGHLYRFAVQFHEILGDPANNDRAVCFWSRADSRSRANAACLVACYMVLIQSWPPHLALAPIAQADPPYMPFRDAGYSQADYVLNIQDIVYGVWKAKEENLLGLKDFNLEEYEKYERVDMGDFNWVSPQFLAFASPQSDITTPIPVTSPQYASLPTCIPDIFTANIPNPFKNVLSHFVSRNIGLVVRLNSPLYCPTYFTALGINHIDMIFDDGTCPPLPLVLKFIRLAHDMIRRNKGIAVHCKAGLGRTGCLIGAYLIYRHGFTANEVIAFMRFMRPGMVVGPQQHWLHLNQGQFREWYLEDQFKAKHEAAAKATTPRKASMKTPRRLASNGQIATPPPNGSQSANNRQASRSALGEIDGNDVSNTATAATTSYQDENLPAPTPGQPRKYARLGTETRHHPYARSASAGFTLAEDKEEMQQPGTGMETEIVSMKTHRTSECGNGECESEEEYTLRMLAHKRSMSRSPVAGAGVGAGRNRSASGKGTGKASGGKGRSVSYTTTTTTLTKSYDVGDSIFDEAGAGVDEKAMGMDTAIWDEVAKAEERSPTRSRTMQKSGSGSSAGSAGSGMIGVQKTRSNTVAASSSPRRSGGEEKYRVRKTSGRIASASASTSTSAGLGIKR
ncbi:hypothetical protein EPUS_02598 [Endocarpon pusillum Z07020]|uniref:protein-tyrosine-phosphatase n=1 Tax=Endocarpon pusillum (strain Z07020 / HMAS-L-300199) TaxID=1263415 RepID=U1GGT3_ENDPU|nr:uncharacterized protein EPUS_02598 [Endocarpon pusillum Z07020]ERF76887.1 hypothetical protein EPUS_02598 [Endocarpon pusillum Z07020]